MPEYLAPGVFVEETSFRQKTIEGVSTSTTGFVGPTRFGPIRGEPALVTSFSDFERIYGGLDQLEFIVGTRTHNYIAHAVRAYFEEGGKRLYVARAFNPVQDVSPVQMINGQWSDGRARLNQEGVIADFDLIARHPGLAGNYTVTFQFKLGPNILDSAGETLHGSKNYDVVFAQEDGAPFGGSGIYWVNHYFDNELRRDAIRLRQDNRTADQDPEIESPPTTITLDNLSSVRILSVRVRIGRMGLFGEEQVWEDLTFHPSLPNSLASVFAERPDRRRTELYVPLIFQTNLRNGAAIAEALLRQPTMTTTDSPNRTILDNIGDENAVASDLSFQVQLSGGNDGQRPATGDYAGDADDPKSGLSAFEDLEDISIIAAPGSTHSDDNDTGEQVIRQLLSHCDRMRYRVAVLDTVNGVIPGEVREMRGTIDSTRAALYYPWIRIYDPVTETEIFNPPSGHIAGIYARNDIERGVHKSPANEVIRLALGYELLVNKGQQESLNPDGINCLRFFEGRGYRVWGARTVSSDPEWKYLNVRRYFAYLERSIEKGTQWAVFENNGHVLWANVRTTIEDFLFNEWKENRLLGTKPDLAYFVRCDRSTMTQNDLDSGRLICLVGVAPLRPAEFVIFRIGQWTADRRS